MRFPNVKRGRARRPNSARRLAVGNASIIGRRVTIGLDVSDRYSRLCVLDARGRIEREDRIRTTPEAVGDWSTGYRSARVVLEVGPHSPWLSRLLKRQGHEAVVANPRRVRLIAEAERKSDRIDAETLARLGRADPKLLRPIEHRGERRSGTWHSCGCARDWCARARS